MATICRPLRSIVDRTSRSGPAHSIRLDQDQGSLSQVNSPSRPAPAGYRGVISSDSCVRNPTGAPGCRSAAGAPGSSEGVQAEALAAAGPAPVRAPRGTGSRARSRRPTGRRRPRRARTSPAPPAGRDHGDLQQGAARPVPSRSCPRAADHGAAAPRRPPAPRRPARPAHVRLMLDGDGDRYGEPDHDRFEDQHGGAEPPHPAPPLRAASPQVSSSPAAAPAPRRRRAATVRPRRSPLTRSPARRSRPGRRTAASSARPTAISIASSSRSATADPVGPEHRGRELGELGRDPSSGPSELRVTTSPVGDGLQLVKNGGHVLVLADREDCDQGSGRRTPRSARDAGRHPGRVVRGVGDHHRAAPQHLQPPRRRHPPRTPPATSCSPSGSPPGPPLANASTAASAQAAFAAWYSPNSGSSRSCTPRAARGASQQLPADGELPADHAELKALPGDGRAHLGGAAQQHLGRRGSAAGRGRRPRRA